MFDTVVMLTCYIIMCSGALKVKLFYDLNLAEALEGIHANNALVYICNI